MDNLTKMCDCPEIQDGWKPKVGDDTDRGVIASVLNETHVRIYGKEGYWSQPTVKNLIFRPSIEQLMEMVDLDAENNKYPDGIKLWESRKLAEEFKTSIYHLDVDDEDGNERLEFNGDSYKECWLHFVMHELHSLNWSGPGWEKT